MGTEIAKPIEEFRGTVMKLGDQFAAALPQHISVEKFQRIVMNAVSTTPELLTKDRRSLLGACMKAAGDGLLLDGREAALVSFGNVVTYMPMVGGLMKKVRNSGEVKAISTACVHEADFFEHWTDEEGEHFKHVPQYSKGRGIEVLAYAFVKTNDGGVYIEVMDREAIEKVRAVSKSKDGPAWKTWWGEMARKAAFRRLAKRLPMSTDLQSVLEHDDETYDIAPERATVVPDRPTRLRAVTREAPAELEHDEPALDAEAAPAQSESSQADDGSVF